MGRVNSRDGRERLLRGATALLAERGYAGTELRDAAARAEAPRGSIYHHFPGGKAELAAVAATDRAAMIRAMLQASLAEVGPVATLERFGEFFRRATGGDPGRLGCPIAAVALTASEPELTGAGDAGPSLHAVAASALADWEAALSEDLQGRGVEPERAVALAALAITTVEGALIRGRAMHSFDAFTAPLAVVAELISASLPGGD